MAKDSPNAVRIVAILVFGTIVTVLFIAFPGDLIFGELISGVVTIALVIQELQR